MLYSKIHLKRNHQFTLNVQMTIEHPGVYALFGPSGSGKTTILRALAGFEPKATAQISLENKTYQDNSHFVTPQERDIGYVSQQDDLFPHKTLLENIQFAQRFTKKKKQLLPKREALLELLQLTERLHHYPNQLSKGEQQRGRIAQTLIQQPRLLLLDEPFANIDYASKIIIIDYLKRFTTQHKMAVIFVSHHLPEVLSFCDFIYTVEQGAITSFGPTHQTLTDFDNPITRSELACSVLEAQHSKLDTNHQLLETTIDGQPFIFSAPSQTKDNYHLIIYAKEVTLFLSKPSDCSALNILRCTVVAIHNESHYSLIKLQLKQQHLLAKITKKSLEKLNIKIGGIIYALIKGVAVSYHSI